MECRCDVDLWICGSDVDWGINGYRLKYLEWIRMLEWIRISDEKPQMCIMSFYRRTYRTYRTYRTQKLDIA